MSGVIFVKNIEQYDDSILESIWNKKNIILSWNINNCSYKEQIAKKEWKTIICFWDTNIDLWITIPDMKKFEGYYSTANKNWIIKLDM